MLLGLVPNASLVGKVLADKPSRSDGGRPLGEGLINLLHAPPLPRDVPDLKIQRNEAPAQQPSENRYLQKFNEAPNMLATSLSKGT